MFPSQLFYQGKDELRKNYANFFQITPDLSSEIVSRTVNGNWVKDEVLLTSTKNGQTAKVAIYYQIEDGLISKMYFYN